MRCDADLLLSEAFARSVGLFEVGPEHFEACTIHGAAGGPDENVLRYKGKVHIKHNTFSDGRRTTRCTNVVMGGDVNRVGFPTIVRLPLMWVYSADVVSNDESDTLCVVPMPLQLANTMVL